jgi:hypothetical protein
MLSDLQLERVGMIKVFGEGSGEALFAKKGLPGGSLKAHEFCDRLQ